MFSNSPKQAVILAGGLGTRLLPLTESMPKPMIMFNGKPFLEYLVENLKKNGFKKILFLLGYKHGVIERYFGDGKKWGVSVSYSVTPVEFDTGARLKAATSQLEELFLLLYCDNYYPFDFEAMWNKYNKSNKSTMVSVYANLDGYTKDNLIVDKDDNVVIYDKSRQTSGLKGVDIGYILSQKDRIHRGVYWLLLYTSFLIF